MSLTEAFKIILLGVVQGVTEWLPISSTGHIILLDEFIKLNVSVECMEMFLVLIQLGSIFAVVVLFWNKLFPFSFKGRFKVKTDIIVLWLKIVIASVPAAFVGLLFGDLIDEYFFNPQTVAFTLILYGILFIITEKINKTKKPRTTSENDISWFAAFCIGTFQTLALVPGTSRSGATILGGIILGLSRTTAAGFSFFLAIPAMFGASAVKLIKFGLHFTAAAKIFFIYNKYI
jgi:undecaprenyl-diphosphatase